MISVKYLDGRPDHVSLLHIAKGIFNIAERELPEFEGLVVVMRVRFVHQVAPDNGRAVFQLFFPDIGAMQGRSISTGVDFGFYFKKLKFGKVYQFPPANGALFWSFMLHGFYN